MGVQLMAQIASMINGVIVEFADTVGNDVDQKLVDALNHCIKTEIAPGHTLYRIWVSSAFDSHKKPSRHVQHKAVDISRINGTRIMIGYKDDAAVKAIVDAIQDGFESFEHRRENYGPHLKKKSGHDWTVAGHKDHIHLSVN